jgi:hypothetical protein
MCTVAFLPEPRGGYLLAHNRDESGGRARGLPPERHERDGVSFLAPRDPDAGGTWLGVNGAGLTICVLNAFEPEPSRLPETPLSRGQVAWGLLHLASADAVEERLRLPEAALDRVRAFQIVVAVPGREGTAGGRPAPAVRLSWDGRALRREDRQGPALFVSSGYDQEGAERERGRRWRALLEADPHPGEARMAAFMADHEPGPGELSVCMHRERAFTVSRTLVIAGEGRIRLRYHDGRPCDPAALEHTREIPISPR